MKMNTLESLAMNNPVRALIQRKYELPLLKKLSGRLDGMVVLEIGCGQGVGTEDLLERFGARKVIAIDLDDAALRRASRRLARYGEDRVSIRFGDAASLEFTDDSFDAVVDLAALHHVPDWQRAVREIARVLRPGGRFLFEEVSEQWINRPHHRVLFDHPAENRFNTRDFTAELERQGIEVGDHLVERGGGDFFFGCGLLGNSPKRENDAASRDS